MQLDTAKTNADIDSTLEYWYHKRSNCPRLAQVAIEVLSLQPISAETRGSSRRVASPLPTRLEATATGMAQTLWLCQGWAD